MCLSDGRSLSILEEVNHFLQHNLLGENQMTRHTYSRLADTPTPRHALQLSMRYGPKAPTALAGEIWVPAVHPGSTDTWIRGEIKL